MSLNDLHLISLQNKCDRVLIVSTAKGNPRSITFYYVDEKELIQINPRLYIVGVKLMFETLNVKRIKPSDIVICSSEELLQPAIILSKLLNCRVVSDADVKFLSNTISIVSLSSVEDGYYNISFTNSLGDIIGPTMRVKFI